MSSVASTTPACSSRPGVTSSAYVSRSPTRAGRWPRRRRTDARRVPAHRARGEPSIGVAREPAIGGSLSKKLDRPRVVVAGFGDRLLAHACALGDVQSTAEGDDVEQVGALGARGGLCEQLQVDVEACWRSPASRATDRRRAGAAAARPVVRGRALHGELRQFGGGERCAARGCAGAGEVELGRDLRVGSVTASARCRARSSTSPTTAACRRCASRRRVGPARW